MSEFEEKMSAVIDCVADIDDYPVVEKSETLDSDGGPTQKVVLVTGGAGKLQVTARLY